MQKYLKNTYVVGVANIFKKEMGIFLVTGRSSCVLQPKLIMKGYSNKKLKKWASGIKRSDKDSFDQLFRLLYPRLKRYARSYTHDSGTASDVVQDAFVSLWQKRSSIKPEKSISSYLFMSVRNKALNHIRDYQDKVSHFNPDYEQIEDTSNQIFTIHNVDRSAEKLASHFKTWINDLPSRQKEAFTLSRFDGFDHEEIAAIMDISPNTVNNHIMAALEYLRTKYQQHKDSNYG